MRLKEKLLQEKSSDIDNLKSQVDRLMSSSRDSKRKHKTLQLQVRTLCDERADFLVQLQDQQRDITALRQRLGLAEKENEDLSKLDLALPSNKAIYDLDDPNRPRFTTQELKDILNERNELKAKVSDLEDELETYRPKPKPESNIRKFVNSIENACDTLINSLQKSSQNVSTIIPSPPIEDDAPVQGPLPLEPDDAPWKKSESGIRKLIFNLGRTGTLVNTGVLKDITVKIKSLGKNSFESITVFGNYLRRGTVVEVFQDVVCQLSQRCLSRLLMSQSPSNQLNPHHMYHSMFHIDPSGNVWFT
ncbi:hypothetical protein WA026_020484 [Henosepilachna vigintioctopunctata]|uniref:RH2 domain-containing protein n=1 Tax=Henosepilachna vigintioctopunctata TaxID=420089 RepID=A0AAW1VG17_9CUCU